MMDQDRSTSKAAALAGEVLTLSRNTLLVNLRFLDAALSQFAPEARPETTLATDGRALYYAPLHVLRTYRAEHTAPARDYLHLVLHCVFQHMWPHRSVEREIWDLACDMAAENAISGLGLMAVTAAREGKQREICERLKREVGLLTAEKLYRRLLEKPPWLAEYEDLPALFHADGHDLWYAGEADSAAQSVWKGVSARMQVDMETFGRRQGDKAAAMMQNLREVNRESYDYAAFLRKLASREEVMRTDPDEFDYIFYTYGMTLLGNVPLIEPLEYKPPKGLKEFVLAVDLTGLLSLDQARQLLRATYEAFRAAETPAAPIRLHLLHCGAAGVEHIRLTCREDLETYLAGLRRKLTGEADPRPAFLWTDEMLHRGELRRLKGLVCLTDGVGPFPPSKPEYDSVFVFVNDNYSEPAVPPWAIRLVLQKDEIANGEQD